jgi:hypothetical protein
MLARTKGSQIELKGLCRGLVSNLSLGRRCGRLGGDVDVIASVPGPHLRLVSRSSWRGDMGYGSGMAVQPQQLNCGGLPR